MTDGWHLHTVTLKAHCYTFVLLSDLCALFQQRISIRHEQLSIVEVLAVTPGGLFQGVPIAQCHLVLALYIHQAGGLIVVPQVVTEGDGVGSYTAEPLWRLRENAEFSRQRRGSLGWLI